MAFMAQPWKHPSGTWYIRVRIPKDVKPYLPEYGEMYKRSLGTKDPREAKLRHVTEHTRVLELFRNARLQHPVTTPLPSKTLCSSPQGGR